MMRRNSWSRFLAGILFGVLLGGGLVILRNAWFARVGAEEPEGAADLRFDARKGGVAIEPTTRGEGAAHVGSASSAAIESARAPENQRSDAAPASAEAAIFGRVVTDDGKPLERWRVALGEGDSSHETGVFTSAAGEFRHIAKNGHMYHLSVGPMSGPSDLRSVVLDEVAVTGRELVIRVPKDRLPTSRIVGTLVDMSGNGVPGVVLAVFLKPTAYSPSAPSDAAGHLEFGPIIPTTVTLALVLPTRRAMPLGKFALHSDSATDLGTIRLPAAGSIEILFSYENVGMGRLEAGDTVAEIYARGNENGMLPPELMQVAAAKFDGHSCVVRDLPPGEYTVLFGRPNYVLDRRTVTVKAGEATEVNVTFRPGAIRLVSFQVEDMTRVIDTVDFSIQDSQGNVVYSTSDIGRPHRIGGKIVFCLPAERFRVIGKSSSGLCADVTFDFAATPPPNRTYEVMLK
jgi:hypothetical protein